MNQNKGVGIRIVLPIGKSTHVATENSTRFSINDTNIVSRIPQSIKTQQLPPCQLYNIAIFRLNNSLRGI